MSSSELKVKVKNALGSAATSTCPFTIHFLLMKFLTSSMLGLKPENHPTKVIDRLATVISTTLSRTEIETRLEMGSEMFITSGSLDLTSGFTPKSEDHFFHFPLSCGSPGIESLSSPGFAVSFFSSDP